MSAPTVAKEVKVWDIFIRFFHWSLVLLFVITYLTGEDESDWHAYFGYAIAVLVTTRIIWGFFGGKYARFSDFVTSPSEVITYLKSLISKTPKHYLGHNPAGGYMVLALLLMLTISTYTGLKAYAVEGKGPLSGEINISLISDAMADDDHDDDEHEDENNKGGDFWEEIHELSAKLTLLLIFLHIAGVMVSGRLHHESLVKAMITGKKEKM